MGSRNEPADPDPQRLGSYLRALAPPARLELLQRLRVPCTVAELGPLETGRPPGALARRSVEGHVKRLQALGLVHARAATRGGRRATEYVTDPARLFLVVEELRQLARIPPMPGPAAPTPQDLQGPVLVLVSGPLEGAAFPLQGPGPWLVGRGRGLAVPLPYDPFVSARNSEVRRGGPGFVLHDLPGSRNGTWLNWRRLAAGEEVLLRTGDVVGVGRSVLIFRQG